MGLLIVTILAFVSSLRRNNDFHLCFVCASGARNDSEKNRSSKRTTLLAFDSTTHLKFKQLWKSNKQIFISVASLNAIKITFKQETVKAVKKRVGRFCEHEFFEFLLSVSLSLLLLLHSPVTTKLFVKNGHSSQMPVQRWCSILHRCKFEASNGTRNSQIFSNFSSAFVEWFKKRIIVGGERTTSCQSRQL